MDIVEGWDLAIYIDLSNPVWPGCCLLLHTELAAIENALTIDERGTKIARNCVLIAICRQSCDKWQSKTLFLTIFDLRSLIVLTISMAAYPVWFLVSDSVVLYSLLLLPLCVIFMLGLCFVVYSKTCLKRPLKTSQNKGFKDKW